MGAKRHPAALLSATALAAAGATYFLDGASGRRRRARARQVLDHGVHVAAEGLGVAVRDLEHRARRVAVFNNAAQVGGDVPDHKITARVRSRLGHTCAHPHAIAVITCEGVVELAGPILTRDVDAVLRASRTTPGVRDVVDRLERHETPGNVPGLQGLPRPRREKRTWPPATRLLVGGAGAATILTGLARGGPIGLAAALLGALAIGRSVTNVPIAELGGIKGRRPAIDVAKTTTIHAPVQDVMDLFTHPESFPRFMRHVHEVKRLGDNRWRWTVVGPGGARFEWDGVIDRLVPDELVSWRSDESAGVANMGSARFETIAPGVTRCTIRLRYWPPGGLVGHEIARLLGDDPKRELDEDVVRLKSLVEYGKTSGRDGVVTWDEVRRP
ncbi:MAG: SRPBCC domain-containing protein [Labilithrix sp.]|nr:SRPBCC domain-containing protein [Labilithrix sp.]